MMRLKKLQALENMYHSGDGYRKSQELFRRNGEIGIGSMDAFGGGYENGARVPSVSTGAESGKDHARVGEIETYIL